MAIGIVRVLCAVYFPYKRCTDSEKVDVCVRVYVRMCVGGKAIE